MPNKNIDIAEVLKNIKWQKLIYPALLVVIFVLVFFNFYIATQFLSSNIASAFSATSLSAENMQTQVPSINMQSYNITIQKVANGTLATSSPSTPAFPNETANKNSIPVIYHATSSPVAPKTAPPPQPTQATPILTP